MENIGIEGMSPNSLTSTPGRKHATKVLGVLTSPPVLFGLFGGIWSYLEPWLRERATVHVVALVSAAAWVGFAYALSLGQKINASQAKFPDCEVGDDSQTVGE